MRRVPVLVDPEKVIEKKTMCRIWMPKSEQKRNVQIMGTRKSKKTMCRKCVPRPSGGSGGRSPQGEKKEEYEPRHPWPL